VQLAEWRDRFTALGVNVAAMSYDARDKAAAFHAEQELGYPILQDEDVRHVDAYGIRNEDYEPGESGYGIPHPGILYIDPDGIIQLKFAVPGYRERPPFEQVYQQIAERVQP
jgi:peroxiredoxin